MSKIFMRNKIELFYFVCAAGIVAGLAEIAWITLYSSVTQQSPLYIATQVTYSITSYEMSSGVSALLGVVLHIALSILLTFAIVLWVIKVRPRLFQSQVSLIVVMCLILSGVWAVNFFLVLPWLNPAFVNIVPYSISFVSKILFALALSLFIRRYQTYLV